jgi:hypothetical protein
MPVPRSEQLSVAQLLGGPERHAGREVTLSGTCLGWSGPALGGPPRTRSDWQIGSREAAVWVSGPLPSGCTGATGGGPARVHGRVEVERISGPDGLRVRPYLVLKQ